jgi:hypothetical protein
MAQCLGRTDFVRQPSLESNVCAGSFRQPHLSCGSGPHSGRRIHWGYSERVPTDIGRQGPASYTESHGSGAERVFISHSSHLAAPTILPQLCHFGKAVAAQTLESSGDRHWPTIASLRAPRYAVRQHLRSGACAASTLPLVLLRTRTASTV